MNHPFGSTSPWATSDNRCVADYMELRRFDGQPVCRCRVATSFISRFLGLMGVIAGTPTFFGTVVGQAWTSTAVSVVFLALAAGSILYVVMELLNVCRLFSSKTVTAWGLLLGLTLGFATDFVLVAAGV